jgi:hypothetical protein
VDRSETAARLELADLLARYQRRADSGRLDELVDLFTADARFETNGGAHQGVEEIREFFDATVVAFTGSDILPGRHHLSSILIEPGEEGTASTYACFIWMGRKGPDHWGTYRDEVVRVDGDWKFRRRRLTVEGWTADSPALGLLGKLDE